MNRSSEVVQEHKEEGKTGSEGLLANTGWSINYIGQCGEECGG